MADNIREQLATAQDEAKKFLDDNGHKPKLFEKKNFIEFFQGIPTAFKIINENPQVLIFILLQWAVICVAYFVWLQILQWIPDRIWDAIAQANEGNRKLAFDLLNIILVVWSFVIVWIASYPISICNSAMVAVHDLRATQQTVTISKCLAVAIRHLGRIWSFTAIDAWITVRAILSRLPKKHGRRRTAADEILYYAWKVATIAVVPALINGRGFIQAGKDSILLLTKQPGRALGLRLGYSAVCWVLAVLAYIAAIFYLMLFHVSPQDAHYIYNFYFIMATPILFVAGIICIAVRPFYLLSVAKFYTDNVDVTEEIKKDLVAMPTWQDLVFSWQVLVLLLLIVAVIAGFNFLPTVLNGF